MDHLLMAGCLQMAGFLAAVAFLLGLLGGARVRRRERDRMSDSWRESQWQRRD